MIRKRIVYTHHDGRVIIVCPSNDIFGIMQNGGYWDDMPRGFVETQIERQIADGIAPDHARRFAHAVAFGGVTEAEAWGIIRDRDCARRGTQHELWALEDIPTDRWFRDAWTRSHNGGPISVNLAKARPIQFKKIKGIWAAENKRRELDMYAKRLPKLNERTLRTAIERARDENELKRVWPEGLAA